MNHIWAIFFLIAFYLSHPLMYAYLPLFPCITVSSYVIQLFHLINNSTDNITTTQPVHTTVTVVYYCIIKKVAFRKICVALKRAVLFYQLPLLAVYLLLVYLVTALVPSETACLANSPGRRRRTAVWISLLVMVERLL